jgi:ketosteroid isomerase-like protein
MDERLRAIKEIQSLVDAETQAWNNLDAESLVSLFHHDMVWVWPPNADSHDPASWEMPMGRFDASRWKSDWNRLFHGFSLAHNHRETVRIEVSEQFDGGFAVVDVDTLWVNKQDRSAFHWKGRACKVYVKVEGRWVFIHQTGLLQYS